MTKLLRITTIIACILMFGIVVGQIYMFEGRRMGHKEFQRQVIDMESRLEDIESQLAAEEAQRLDYLVYRIITCESGWNEETIGDNGKAQGLAQFWEATFYYMAKKAGLQNPDWHNQHQQILLLKWAIWQGIAQKHWQRCYKEAMA